MAGVRALVRGILGIVIGVGFVGAALGGEPVGDASRSTVQVFVTYNGRNYLQPWQTGSRSTSVGSGFLIEGGRIVTNAHVVRGHCYVEVVRTDRTTRYPALVEHVADDVDLALLTIPDASFHQGLAPLKLASLPAAREPVSVYGFPIGGTKLSITQGTVSRVQLVTYAHSGQVLLAIQIDAAVNPGNSGGPVLRGSEVVGVTHQVNRAGEGLSYAIPAPLVRRFLDDVKDGRYDGVPALGLEVQGLQNKSLAAFLGLAKDQTGVRICGIRPLSPATPHLRVGDVLLKIDGAPIADDGTVELSGERLPLSVLIDQHQSGATVVASILRDRKPLQVSIVLKEVERLVPPANVNRKPSYYLHAGLLFMPLDGDYLRVFTSSVPSNLSRHLQVGAPSAGRRQLVVITQVLPHAANAGYHDIEDVVVSRVNGSAIGSISDVVRAFETNRNATDVIETEEGTLLVLDAAQARSAGPEILARYGIPADRSADVTVTPASPASTPRPAPNERKPAERPGAPWPSGEQAILAFQSLFTGSGRGR